MRGLWPVTLHTRVLEVFCRLYGRSCPPGLDMARVSKQALADSTASRLTHFYSAQGFLVDSLDPRVPWRLSWSYLLVGPPPGRLISEFVNAAPEYVLGWLDVDAQVPRAGGRTRRGLTDPGGLLKHSPLGGASCEVLPIGRPLGSPGLRLGCPALCRQALLGVCDGAFYYDHGLPSPYGCGRGTLLLLEAS